MDRTATGDATSRLSREESTPAAGELRDDATRRTTPSVTALALPSFRCLSHDLITSGQPSEEHLSGVALAGFEVVINLALHGAEYSLPDERSSVETLGMTYEHIPVIWQHPVLANLETFFATMARHAGRRIYVHCAANKRVSVFVFLYRVLRLGWKPEDAHPDLYAVWSPDPTWQAFIDLALSGASRPSQAAG
jgi:protein tyrosine phosphatase (PTP) superfamily phosphohydrolase (DUF442 family)